MGTFIHLGINESIIFELAHCLSPLTDCVHMAFWLNVVIVEILSHEALSRAPDMQRYRVGHKCQPGNRRRLIMNRLKVQTNRDGLITRR